MLKPKRELSLYHVFGIIIGTVIGSGVFINIPIVQKATGSPILATFAWLVGGLILIPQIFIFSELGTAYPEQGFGYTYLKKAGSPSLAFLYVWTAFWITDMPSITIMSVAGIVALKFFFPILANSILTKIIASLLILTLTSVHYFSVKKGGNFQFVITIIKISPLILLSIFGVILFRSENLFIAPLIENYDRNWLWLIILGVSGTIWSYAGFPNVLYMAGEIKDPQRNIPKALITSLFFVTLVYTLVGFASGLLIPHNELINLSGSFANPFKYLPWFAGIAGGFLAISAFISITGATNACIMAQPRLQYSIARDGLFFKSFAYLHPKYGTPSKSIIFQSGAAIILIFIGGIESLLGYFTFAFLFQNILIFGSIFWLKKRKDYNPTYKAPMWKTMVLFSLIIQPILIIATFQVFPFKGVIIASAITALGLPAYLFFKNYEFDGMRIRKVKRKLATNKN